MMSLVASALLLGLFTQVLRSGILRSSGAKLCIASLAYPKLLIHPTTPSGACEFDWPREFRNSRISHRGREGGERYGQRRDDRATDPLPPGMRSCDRARRQRTRVDDCFLRDEGEGGCPEHEPEVSPHQRAAAF